MLFAQANLGSINTSYNYVERIIKQKNINVMLLTEIWHPNHKKSTFLKNWRWWDITRKDKAGGGAAIVVDSSIKAIKVKDLNVGTSESVWIEIYVNNKKILLGSAYAPPEKRR